jgi:hypothetical protein
VYVGGRVFSEGREDAQAIAFAREGANVVISYLSEEEADAQ